MAVFNNHCSLGLAFDDKESFEKIRSYITEMSIYKEQQYNSSLDFWNFIYWYGEYDDIDYNLQHGMRTLEFNYPNITFYNSKSEYEDIMAFFNKHNITGVRL